MSKQPNPQPRKIAFLDRDGCLLVEPGEDHHVPFQICSLEEMQLTPKLISGLKTLVANDYELVMVTNQDDLGKPGNPTEIYQSINTKLFEILASEDISFSEVFCCPHSPPASCACRKPKTGMVEDFLANTDIDMERSFVAGDRDSDIKFAHNIGVSGFLTGDYENWLDMANNIVTQQLGRSATISRHTKETQIDLQLNLDGSGNFDGQVSNGFLTHMLELLAKHGQFDISIQADGDTHYDDHHLIEDVAISLGQAFRQAVGDKKGIKRFGQRALPLDETLVLCVVDLSGRAAFETDYEPEREKVNDFSTEMVSHFFFSLATNALMSIHLQMLNKGRNEHHRIEAMFKSFAKAMREATEIDNKTLNQVASTKGIL